MDQRPEVRVSDTDRQQAVDRLRVAMDEGRLSLLEYDSRLAKAYTSVTYRDLGALFTDLPQAQRPTPAPAPPAPAKPVARGFFAGLPGGLRVLWSVWLSIVVVAFVSWVMVDISNDGHEDFWPRWLLIPTAILLAISVSVTAARRSRAAR